VEEAGENCNGCIYFFVVPVLCLIVCNLVGELVSEVRKYSDSVEM
jgi:hypothetical protein